VLLRPLHQFDEQEIHDAGRPFGHEAHQIQRSLLARLGEEQVGEGQQLLALPHQRHRRAHQVARVERAQRETLLARVLVAQPGVGNLLQARQQRRHRVGRHDLQPQAVAD